MQRVRRWFLVAVPLAALWAMLLVSLWLSSGSAHRGVKKDFERIREGMSPAEVQTLLSGTVCVMEQGAAPSTVDACYADKDPHGLMPANVIRVKFSNGKAVCKAFYPSTDAELFRRLRNRLGL